MNISDVAREAVPMDGHYQMPLNESSFSLLASVLATFKYLGLLFILESDCLSNSAGQFRNE